MAQEIGSSQPTVARAVKELEDKFGVSAAVGQFLFSLPSLGWAASTARKKRIAAGSGTSVQEINRMLKQFTQMQKMMKQMN